MLRRKSKQGRNGRKLKFSEFLSDLSVEVIVVLTTRDEVAIKELSEELAQYEANAIEADEPDLATYFRVLNGLLRGEDVSAEAETLVEPFRWGYERILQELEEAPRTYLAGRSVAEWLTLLTGLVATTAREGSAEERAELEQELIDLAGRISPEERAFHAFIAVLRAVLRGENTQAMAHQLISPFREAYQSLLQLLAAEETPDFALFAILDRIQHNTIVALTQRSRRLRLAVAEALADIEEILPEDDPATPHLRLLILGALALLLERKVPAKINTLPEPFATTWQNIFTASQG